MRIVILSILILFMSCSSSKNILSLEELNAFKQRVENKNFEVISDWVQPMGLNTGVTGLQSLFPPGSSINNISLIGNTNFFRVQKDSIDMHLPYYGQQRMSTGYGSDGSLNFNGKIEKQEINFHQKNNSYILKYWLKAENEQLDVVLTLFSNNTSSLAVNSIQRSSIVYNGFWKEIK